MSERENLEQAIAAVEAQRESLGDTAVDAMLDGLRQKLAELDEEASESPTQTVEQTSGGERRIVTVLFCDIAGSTALAEKMDPERWAEIVEEAFELLIEPIDRFGGTVARLMGDAVLAFFGAPTAHEDDPQRAVQAGLAILENIRPFHDRLLRDQNVDFNVRVGINTGLVVTGRVGSEVFEEYTALGDAVNLASRMEQTAAPGTVQIAQSTYRLVESQFDFVLLGGISVKGKSEPVQAYRVLGRIAQSEQDQRLAQHGIRSPLVGRQVEFKAAREAVARLLDGHGGLLSIIGEAGAGKSRLRAELRQDSPLESLNWLEGHTLSYGHSISYWPFQEILWDYAGINEEDSETTAWQKLEKAVSHLFGQETGEFLPFLANLISLEVKGAYAERAKHLDSEALGHQIYRAARGFFERLSMERPAILVFEDLHWADESSALLLEHLLPLIERCPILFLVTGRPYRESSLSSFREVAQRDYAARYKEIELNPLSEADSVQLARNLLDIDRMPAEVRETIVTKASGNPFFIEEIIRSMIDSGAVVYNTAESRWQATAKARHLAVPDTVQGVIMARVDRLDNDVRRVLEAAAVVGRNFFFRVLEAMGNVEEELSGYLNELEQVELIGKKQSMPELEYMFKHALAQETTYQSILFRKRRRLHLRVGQAIEKLFSERLDDFYGVLAYHYANAEQWDKAQDYLFKAGDKAGQVAADAEALAHYRQALDAYERAFGDRWDPVERAVLARKMGEAYFRRGDHEQALDQFKQAFKLLGRPSIPAKGLPTIMAIAGDLLRQIGHRLLPGLFIKPVSDDISVATQEEVRIHYVLGWIFLFTERERLLWACLRRVNFGEQSGYLAGAASGSAAFGVVMQMAPLMKIAEGYQRRAVKLADESGDLNALGVSYQALGFFDQNNGDFESSAANVRRSEEVFRQAGDLHGLGTALLLLTFNDIHRGRFVESFAYIKELISTGQDGADPQLVCWGYILQGRAFEPMGRLQEAIADLLLGIQLTDALPDYYWKISGLAFLGRCFLRLGWMDKAFETLAEGGQVQEESRMGGPPLYFLRSVQMEAYLIAADRGDDSARSDHLKNAKKARKPVMKLSKAYRIYAPEAFRLDGTYNWLRGKREEAVRSWQLSLDLGQEMDQPYMVGLSHLEMGRRLGERSRLEKAEAIFEEVGAARQLRQLQKTPNE